MLNRTPVKYLPLEKRVSTMVRTTSSKYQKKVTQHKRFRAGPKALQEIQKYKKSCELLIHKVPYKHLLTEFAQQLKGECEAGSSRSVPALHEASQAYLAGLFEGADHVCDRVAKRESTSFLLCLANIGLKKLVTTMANDKELTKKVKEEHNEHRHHHHHHHHHEHHHHHHDHQEDQNEHNEHYGEDSLATDMNPTNMLNEMLSGVSSQ